MAVNACRVFSSAMIRQLDFQEYEDEGEGNNSGAIATSM